MKPLLTILFLLSIPIAKTAGGNTASNCCYEQFWKNNNCLIKAEKSRLKKDKAESDISLFSIWDVKMLLM